MMSKYNNILSELFLHSALTLMTSQEVISILLNLKTWQTFFALMTVHE